MIERPSHDKLFLMMCELIELRGTCTRAQVGAVIVQDRRVVSMGYNGAPPGQKHCTEVGCTIGAGDGCARAIHAEANAIAWAARHGVPTFGATMYCTYSPCQRCAELILSAGIGRFVYAKSYRAERLDLLNHIEVIQLAAEQSGEHEQVAGASTSDGDTSVPRAIGVQPDEPQRRARPTEIEKRIRGGEDPDLW